MKKILSLILIVCFFVSVFPAIAVNANTSGKMYQVKPYYTVDAFEIIGSDSHCESNDVTNKTIYVDSECTLKAAEQVDIGIYPLADGTTLQKFKEDIWDEKTLKYTMSPTYVLSTYPGTNLLTSIKLKKGTYAVDVTKGGNGVFALVIVGGEAAETPEEIPEEKPITVYLNGKKVEFDVEPILENGRTLVPVRAIFEAMGMTVGWNGETSTVTATGKGNLISMRVNETKATVNGKIFSLDVPAKIIDGRTLVPVRFIAESLGAKVDWNGENRAVYIEYDTFDFVKQYNSESFSKLLNQDYSFKKWYDWCVKSTASGEAVWAANSVIKFWQDPKDYIIKETKETIDRDAAYQEYYTAVLTDALLSNNAANMLKEELVEEQIKGVAKGYIDLANKIVDLGIAENKAELENLIKELDEIIANPKFLGNRSKLSGVEKEFERVLTGINQNKLDGADLKGAKNALNSLGVVIDITSVGYEAYKEAESIKALQNVKIRYIGGLVELRNQTTDKNLKAALDKLIGIMNQSFNEVVSTMLETTGEAFLKSDTAEKIASNILKHGAEKALTLVFKLGEKEAKQLVDSSFGVIGKAITAGKITTAVCDVVAGTSKSVNASMDLKMTMEVMQAIDTVINDEYLSGNVDFSNMDKEFIGICNVQKAVMAHASCLTNVIYNAQDNSNYDKVARALMQQEVYDGTADRITEQELERIAMISFICTE